MQSHYGAPDHVLVKTSTDNGRWQMLQMIKVPGALIHFKGNLVLQETLPGAKRPLHMASAIPAILGKYASITAVDLIQWKKLDSRNFYESKGSQIWNYFILYCSIRRMMVLCMNSGISDMITILTSAAFL